MHIFMRLCIRIQSWARGEKRAEIEKMHSRNNSLHSHTSNDLITQTDEWREKRSRAGYYNINSSKWFSKEIVYGWLLIAVLTSLMRSHRLKNKQSIWSWSIHKNQLNVYALSSMKPYILIDIWSKKKKTKKQKPKSWTDRPIYIHQYKFKWNNSQL